MTFSFFRQFLKKTFVIIIIGGVIIKKNIGIILLAVSLCTVFSKALFSTYRAKTVMEMNGNIYFLQYGSFINYDVMSDNIEKLDDYVIYEEDGKYYVYLGAYTNLENALKMQKKLEDNGIYTYIKNDYIGNSDLFNKIEQLDQEILLDTNKITNYNKKILNILKEE